MAYTFFGFYDLDAAPQHGLTGELATRLGAASSTPGFIEGSLYVRSDNGGVAIAVRHEDDEGWVERGAVATLLYAADWRARDRDAATYDSAGNVAGDGDPLRDSTFFVVQRFVVRPERGQEFVAALRAYAERYAAPIPGFLSGDAFASIDGTRVLFVMAWAHEAALNALENGAGSLEAMQTHLRLTERHVFESYQRVSSLVGAAA